MELLEQWLKDGSRPDFKSFAFAPYAALVISTTDVGLQSGLWEMMWKKCSDAILALESGQTVDEQIDTIRSLYSEVPYSIEDYTKRYADGFSDQTQKMSVKIDLDEIANKFREKSFSAEDADEEIKIWDQFVKLINP